MNEKINNFLIYIWREIKTHPLTVFVTVFNLSILFLNSYAIGVTDYNNTRKQVYANTNSIDKLTTIISTNSNRITILEQIAKNAIESNNRNSDELSKLNNNFTLYLERQAQR